MSETGQPGTGQQPSEEELRQYLAQLRDAGVDEIIAQVLSLLANGAQVKLGRPDARVLIDSIDAIGRAAGPNLEQRLQDEVSQLVQQLKTAQVQAEQGEQGEQPPGAQAPQPDAGAPSEGPGQGQASGESAGSEARKRLWLPGDQG